MIKTLRASAVALTLAFIPAIALAQVSPGTTLNGTLDQDINSQNAQVGQTFTISNAHSSNYNINGATIYGHVVSVQRAGQGTPGKLELQIDKVNTRSGNVYAATGYVSNANMTTKSNAGKEAVGAIAGAVVGSLLGHGGGGKTFGTLAGAAGGYLYAKNSRENVNIAAGSNVSVAVSTARRQSSPPRHY
ncbi:MAG: hypothetical protein M3126_06020 [Candidatus Eremiobacteraeota bacterium]|nr:hypothetical protein [Candidatus Eremiobacteraeota bacterium]